MGAALAAQLTAQRDGFVGRLDTSLKEVRGDPAALRGMKDAVAEEAGLANTTGGRADQHAHAAEPGWQGGAYTTMRSRVQGVAGEYTDAGSVLSKAASGFERAATALETATASITKVRQSFTSATDALIDQARRLAPPQEAAAAPGLTKSMETSGKQAVGAADKALQNFDREMQSIAGGIGPAKTATAGRQGNTGYVVYPNGEVRMGGDRAWRNNNPGNLVYGPRARRFGAIGTDGHNRRDPFAIFPDQASGEAAMRDLMREKHRDQTLTEALRTYAPAFENNIPRYARSVAEHSGLDIDKTIGTYTPEEFDRLISGMRMHEGARPGTIHTRDNAPSWLLPLLGP